MLAAVDLAINGFVLRRSGAGGTGYARSAPSPGVANDSRKAAGRINVVGQKKRRACLVPQLGERSRVRGTGAGGGAFGGGDVWGGGGRSASGRYRPRSRK